jgi:hypothetical protein
MGDMDLGGPVLKQKRAERGWSRGGGRGVGRREMRFILWKRHVPRVYILVV